MIPQNKTEVNFEDIPEVLTSLNQWVLWKHTDDGHKPPYHPLTGRQLDITGENAGSDFGTVKAVYEQGGYDGIGFILLDGLVCIDLDDCIDSWGIDQWADDISTDIAGYTELSPSGTGIHIWTRGNIPANTHKKHIEIYSTDRYMTVTGNAIDIYSWELNGNQNALERLYKSISTPVPTSTNNTRPYPVRDAIQTIEAIMKWRPDVWALYKTGNWQGRYDSQSNADMALVRELVKFSNGAPDEQIDMMFRESGLMREKWNERHGYRTYGEQTIERARTYLS